MFDRHFTRCHIGRFFYTPRELLWRPATTPASHHFTWSGASLCRLPNAGQQNPSFWRSQKSPSTIKSNLINGRFRFGGFAPYLSALNLSWLSVIAHCSVGEMAHETHAGSAQVSTANRGCCCKLPRCPSLISAGSCRGRNDGSRVLARPSFNFDGSLFGPWI